MDTEAKQYAVCHWCGKKIQYTRCSQACTIPDDALCIVLKGWISICHCIDTQRFNYYNFCSITCIKMWSDSKTPDVPEPFLKAFVEKEQHQRGADMANG